MKFLFFGLLGGGGKRAENSPKWKITITSVTCHISGTIKHMIMILDTLVLNDDISRCFFHFFEISIFWAVRGGKRAKNCLKMKNTNYIRHTPYLRNSIAYDHDFWYASVKWWYLQVFFSLFFFLLFFVIFIFQAVMGVKGQKMALDEKKVYLLHFISQETHIIWLLYMVHVCKMMISAGVFFIVSNFDSLVCWAGGGGGKRAKNGQKWE